MSSPGLASPVTPIQTSNELVVVLPKFRTAPQSHTIQVLLPSVSVAIRKLPPALGSRFVQKGASTLLGATGFGKLWLRAAPSAPVKPLPTTRKPLLAKPSDDHVWPA